MWLVEHREVSPAQLRRLAISLGQQSDERMKGIRVPALSGGIDMLGPERPLHEGPGQPRPCGIREATVALVGPLHRCAHGKSSVDGEVLSHPDLLAVEQHRRAGEGEQQAVDHPDPSRVTIEHGRQPSPQSAAVHLHVRVRPEGGEHLGPFPVRELVQRELVVVSDEGRPL